MIYLFSLTYYKVLNPIVLKFNIRRSTKMQCKLLNVIHFTTIYFNAISNKVQFKRLIHNGPVKQFSYSFTSSLLKNKQKVAVTLVQNIKLHVQKTIKLSPNLTVWMSVNILKKIPKVFESHSAKIVQTCVQNCEYVLAHRMRRSQQMLYLYSKLWDESSFHLLFNKLCLRLRKHRTLLLSSGLVTAYDWNRERIPDEDILRYSAEMSLVEFLRVKRKACLKGTARPADCHCPVCSATDSEWQSFVEKDDIVVWKREDDNHRGQGLYCYKMYARYEDVTAYDFLEAQIDLEYRLSWDTHAVALRLIDSEPRTNSDVIYWETKWPKLFNNRDYVFKRRYRIDKQRNLIYLVNQCTEHPSCPVLSSKQRVREYWSYMIIKPQTSFDKPGIEFSLTYFDNPGTNVPSSLTTWVTVTEMPDYLKKLRMAALGVAKRRGDAPSPLASKDNGISAPNGPGGRRIHTQQTSSSSLLHESLRGTLFLF